MTNELLLDIEDELISDWTEQRDAALAELDAAGDAVDGVLEQFKKHVENGETAKGKELLDAASTRIDKAKARLKTVWAAKPWLVRVAEMTDEQVLAMHKKVMDNPEHQAVLGKDFLAGKSAAEIRQLSRSLELLMLKKKIC